MNDESHIDGPSRIVTTVVTVVCVLLALAFGLLGGGLIVGALASMPGALFVGHLEASGILLLLGFMSLVAAVGSLAVPILLASRRQGW